MTKYYYIDLADECPPFAKVHSYNEQLKELPKNWEEITKEEYEEITQRRLRRRRRFRSRLERFAN